MKKGYILPIIILVAFIAALALTSILKDDEDKEGNEEIINLDDIDFSFSNNGMFFQKSFFCDKGVIRYNAAVDSDKSGFTFYSFDKKASIVLCNNIDCEHNSSDCPAWFEEGQVYAVYYYKNKQYIISQNNNNTYAKMDLYEADSDGTNRQRLHKFDYYCLDECFCKDNMIYMFATEQRSQFETDADGKSYEVPRTIKLVSYNLDTGEVREDTVCEAGYQQIYWFLGEYNGKVYYRYQYLTKPLEEVYDENGEPTNDDHEELAIEGIGGIDINNNKMVETITEGEYVNPIGYSNGKLYWYIGSSGYVYKDLKEIYVYSIDSKKTEVISVDVDIPESTLRVIDDKLFFNYSNWYDENGKNGETGLLVYNLETGQATEYDISNYILGEYGDYYVLSEFHISLNCCTHVVKKALLEDENEYFSVLN